MVMFLPSISGWASSFRKQIEHVAMSSPMVRLVVLIEHSKCFDGLPSQLWMFRWSFSPAWNR